MLIAAVLVAFAAVAIRAENFTMSASPAPQPGSTYEITWSPTSSDQITILLNSFDPSNPSLPIIITSSTIATVTNTGSYLWNVPSGLCGRYSFSLEFEFERPIAYSHIWSGVSCGSPTPITVAPSTACIPSSTSVSTEVNSFIIPNADQYPFRTGKTSYISWKPTTPGSVSLTLQRKGSTETITIADNIPNSGFYAWTPDSSLDAVTSMSALSGAVPYTLQLIAGSQSTTSHTLYVLSDTYPTYFVNSSSWIYPTVRQPTTIQWSPSNEASISIQLAFGAGAVPGPNNTIIIADKVPNTGSWTWNVPSDFTPGQYILSGLNGQTGAWETTLISIVVGIVPAVPCWSSADLFPPITTTATFTDSATSTKTPLSTISSIAINSISTATLNVNAPEYAQVLHLTSCGSIAASYTSLVVSGTTTSFQTIGCSTSASSTITAAPSCYSDYSTISVGSNRSVCCPSAWSTSSIGDIWCYTSTALAVKTITARNLATATPGFNIVVIQNLVFARAGTVGKSGGKSNEAGSLGLSMGLIVCGVIAAIGFMLTM